MCGTVSRAVSMRTNQDGKQVASFAVKTCISGKGEELPVEVFVDYDTPNIGQNTVVPGRRIEVQGVLTFRKKGDRLYWNLTAASLDLNPTSTEDAIEGDMEFRGTIGKQVDERIDKRGNKYLSFSAYSAEKVGETFEYLWVRFIRFAPDREIFLQPKARILAKGKLSLSVYKGRLSIECRLEQIEERQTLPFRENKGPVPF
jgi:hypothetical protein